MEEESFKSLINYLFKACPAISQNISNSRHGGRRRYKQPPVLKSRRHHDKAQHTQTQSTPQGMNP